MKAPGDRFRYSRWDGTQEIGEPDADEILAQLEGDLMQFGDLRTALRQMMQRGMQGAAPMQGLRDLLRQLREERRQRLERFDMSGVMDSLREELDAIVDLERAALAEMRGEQPPQQQPIDPFAGPLTDEHRRAMAEREAAQARAPEGDGSGAGVDDADGGFASSLMGDIAHRNEAELDALPEETAARIRALQDYEFTSPEAARRFEELLDQLRNAMTRSFFRDLEQNLREMSDADIQRMKDMVRDLNEMLVDRIAGEEPDFDGFMDRYGDMFGDHPPQSLDDLIQRMQSQMAAMQSLMMSMPTDQFEQLQQLLSDRLGGDPGLDAALRQLAQKLDFLDPMGGQRHRFSGDQQLDLQGAMRVMEQMQGLEELESQLRQAQGDGDLSHIDLDRLEEMLGPESRESVEQMNRLLEILEEAGYIDRSGGDPSLTPRGMRMIGQQALGEIYRSLKRQSLGNHATPEEGRFGERLEDTKGHEFGEPFDLHMSRTLRNALRRAGPGTPVALAPEDFEIHRSEVVTRTATVMLVDLSWSMELRGAFPSAKRVALALNNLITSAYPRDSFYVVGFSAYAKELKAHEIPMLAVDEYVLGTNIQHALVIAEQLLDRHRTGTRQVLMITDGEPTAHLEGGRAQFAYPPTPQTIRETLRAVKRCTSKGITINTFMLDESHYLRAFMDQVSKINGGRVFYSSPEKLGEYILVDYVDHKRKVLGRR